MEYYRATKTELWLHASVLNMKRGKEVATGSLPYNISMKFKTSKKSQYFFFGYIYKCD